MVQRGTPKPDEQLLVPYHGQSDKDIRDEIRSLDKEIPE